MVDRKGMDKIGDLLSDHKGKESEDSEGKKVDSTVLETDGPVAPVQEVVDPQEELYLKMTSLFQSFLDTHPSVSTLGLKMLEQKPGEYLVYQGSRTQIWAWLRRSQCSFERSSLLRCILNLPKKSFLYRYFRNYELTFGGKRGTL